MSKNPLINALSASAYIIFIVTIMTFVTQPLKDKPDTFFAWFLNPNFTLGFPGTTIIIMNTFKVNKHF